MIRMMRLRTALTLGLVLIGTGISAFAAPPTVVVSVKSVDELLDHAELIGSSVGSEGLKDTAEQFINSLTGGAGLTAFDREKPFGFYWSVPESAPNDVGKPVVFLPVSDVEELKKLISMFVPDFKDDDGQWSMTVQGQNVVAKMVHDYCFFSESAEGLTDLLNPEAIVNSDYDIAIDLNLASIPKDLKSTFLEAAETEGRKNMENDPEPKNEAEAAGRKMGFEWFLGVLKAVTNDGDRLTIGIKVDDETRLGSFDFDLTGVSNSTLAKSFAVYSKTTPAFASVATDSAPFRMTLSHPTTSLIEPFDELLAAARKATEAEIDKDEKLQESADKNAAKDVANRLYNIVQATVKSGSMHSIVVLEAGDNDTVRILGGTKIPKGDDAGKLLDDIVKLAKQSPDFAKVKVDVAKHAGARIHSIEGEFDDKEAALFGDSPGHLAIRSDSLWLSFGGGNLDALKAALDLSGKKVSKSTAPISIYTKPATLVTLMEQEDEALVQRAEIIAGEPGDLLNFEVVPTEKGGIKLHIEFGIDLFKLGIGK